MSTEFTTQTVSVYPAETTSNVVTSWLPLVSPFTPDPDCYTADFHNNVAEQFDYVLIAFDPDYTYYIGSSSVTCIPTEVVDWYDHRSVETDTTTASAQTTSLATITSLMPLTCPDGWNTVLTTVLRSSSVQVTCCPSGYSLDASDGHGIDANCSSTLPPGETIYYLPTSGDAILQTAFTSAVEVAAVAVIGWNIDDNLVTTSSTSTVVPTSLVASSPLTPPPLSSSSPSLLPAATPTPNTTSSSSSHASAGTIAGSVVGSLAGVALIGLSAFMFLRRQKAKRNGEDNATKGQPEPTSAFNQYNYSVVSQRETGDRSTIMSEMPTISNTPELFSDHDLTSPRPNPESYELE